MFLFFIFIMNKKYLIFGEGHHKVIKNLIIGFKKMNVVFKQSSDNNDILDFDVIYSCKTKIDAHNYPNKKFIFGPCFCVYPDNSMVINNQHNNVVFILPSPWCIDFFKMFKYDMVPMIVSPTGVDTEYFCPSNDISKITNNENVFLYYKPKLPEQEKKFALMTEFLNKKNIKYKIFEYGKYKEVDYLKFLDTASFGIWVGVKETQGIALEEALSMNVPLFVWNHTWKFIWDNKQKNPFEPIQNEICLGNTTPYWDDTCGIVFNEFGELEQSFDKFICNIQMFKPREFILKKLTIKSCTEKFLSIWN